MYISVLSGPNKIDYTHMYNFADDTTLIMIADTWDEAITKANQDYDLLTDWYKNSRLSLNISKTKYMLFGGKPTKHWIFLCKTQSLKE